MTANSQTNPNQTALSIDVDNLGLLKPRNIEEAFRLAKAYSMSGVLPDRYANKPEMVLTAMQMSLELGLKPLTGLCKIAVVKGTPTVFGDMPLAMVYASGSLEYIKEVYFDADGIEILAKNKNLTAPVFGAICIVKRKGDSEPRETYFTLSEANDAGLIGGRGEAWNKYPKLMLKYRARSQALKDKFPDALNGIAIAEYDHHMTEAEIIDVPSQNVPPEVKSEARSLGAKLRAKAEAVDDSNEGVIIENRNQSEDSNDE